MFLKCKVKSWYYMYIKLLNIINTFNRIIKTNFRCSLKDLFKHIHYKYTDCCFKTLYFQVKTQKAILTLNNIIKRYALLTLLKPAKREGAIKKRNMCLEHTRNFAFIKHRQKTSVFSMRSGFIWLNYWGLRKLLFESG